MFNKEEKNINLLLQTIDNSIIKNWRVSNLRKMEWEGEIRLDLHVVLNEKFLRDIYVREWNTPFDKPSFIEKLKHKITLCFKHYVHSFLGIKIGDVNRINFIETSNQFLSQDKSKSYSPTDNPYNDF